MNQATPSAAGPDPIAALKKRKEEFAKAGSTLDTLIKNLKRKLVELQDQRADLLAAERTCDLLTADLTPKPDGQAEEAKPAS